MASDEVKELLGQGAQLLKEGKLDEAIAKLKAAVDADPSNIQAHAYLGAAYASDGQGPASVEQFQAAVDLDPTSAVHTFNLGQAFEKAGSKPRAMDLYQKALVLDPKYARAQQRLDAMTGGTAASARPAPPAPAAPPTQPAVQTMPSAPAPGAPRPMAPVAPVGGPSQVGVQSQYSAPPQPMGYTAPPPPVISRGNAVLEHGVKSAASWLYFIAGLSLINTIVSALGIGFRFAVGLGVTSMLDSIMHEASKGGAGKFAAAICLPITIGLLVMYAALGYFAGKGMRWAFITAVVLYSLDTLLVVASLFMGDMLIIGLVFHIWALVRIFGGIGAAGQLGQIRQQEQAAARQQEYRQRTQQPPSSPVV